MSETILVGLGGAIGSIARYWIVVLAMPLSRQMPWSTVGINILGSFLIGLFGTLTLNHGRFAVPELGRLFFMVGICGGFTTFSSFSLQTLDLLRGGHVGRALLNVAASVLLCLTAVAVGHAIGATLNGGAAQVAQIMREEAAS